MQPKGSFIITFKKKTVRKRPRAAERKNSPVGGIFLLRKSESYIIINSCMPLACAIDSTYGKAALVGELAVLCTCNPLKQGRIPAFGCVVCSRVMQVVMRGRSCATLLREPCQAGNRAALSGKLRVPQERRS